MSKEYPQTLIDFILKNHPEYLPLFVQLESAGKIVASKLRKVGLEGNLGLTGTRNVYGEEVQKLDDFANSLFIEKLTTSGQIKTILSEELENPIDSDPNGEYIFAMDPLDGSSNIDVNLSLGSIFSIYPSSGGLLQPGREQLVSGYILYSTSTMIVLTFGNGAHGFTLDPEVDSFFLTHPNIKIPESGDAYSINEGNTRLFKENTQKYLEIIKNRKGTKLRYAAAMVADIHRFLLTGGLFLYPSDISRPDGKLRLVYEVNPISWLVQQAGGKAVSTQDTTILDPLEILPTGHDQKAPAILGSPKNVDEFVKITKSI